MVEYIRLISKDSLFRIANDWNRQDTLVLIGILAALFVFTQFVVKRK